MCRLRCYLLLVCCILLSECHAFLERSSDSQKGYFWHISDIHVDQNYSQHGNPNKLCHEDGSFQKDNGLYGNFLCDSPQKLVDVTLKSMKNIHPKPDFIIWTGDSLPHASPEWNTTYEAINNITTMLTETFPNIPIYPSIGNHDTSPPNVLIPCVSRLAYRQYLYRGGWNKILPEVTWSTFLLGGFYSHLINAKLRLISLNTILWYSPNTYVADLKDPEGQLKWLDEVLQLSTNNMEKVYIIGHVPPGFYSRGKPGSPNDPTYHLQYTEEYLKILKKYSTIIQGQMFGHLHMDMFQLYECNTGTVQSSALLGSSVTPWHSVGSWNISLPVNPSIRLIHYDVVDSTLMDYDQYYCNLSKVNEVNSSTKEPSNFYELLYSFCKTYEVPDVSTYSLTKVYEKLKSSEHTFKLFYIYLTSGKETVPCNEECITAQLCSMASTSAEEYSLCMKSTGIDLAAFSPIDEYSKASLILVVCVLFIIFAMLTIFVYLTILRKNVFVSPNVSYHPLAK